MSFEALIKTVQTLTEDVTQRDVTIKALRLTIEKLKIELTHLKRMRYGRSSEKMQSTQEQLDLLSTALAPLMPVGAPAEETKGDATGSNVADLDNERKKRRKKSTKPAQSGLPEHLPREDVVHSACAPDCKCGACGTGLQQIGQDVSEVLDYEPGSFKVIRHIRPKFACTQCHTVTQAPAASRPIDRCMAGAGLIAHVMVSKYADHCPLYRQSQICAREEVIIAASTMGGWMGNGAALLTPLAQAVGRYVMQAYKVHSDDTPTRALGGAKGKAHLGRIWTYVRDDRAWGDSAHPAAWFQYSEDRRGEHPRQHLGKFSGVLQVDAFAGYNSLFTDGRVVEAACWAHARRKYFEIHKQQDLLPGTLAHQALQRIAKIYAVESEVRGQSKEMRRSQRQLRTRPVLQEMHEWLHAALGQISAKSPMALAIGYSLSNWRALTRFLDDGRIEADNNIAERALRGVAIGRKNYLHFGSDGGGHTAAVIYTLIGTAKLCGINPHAYLRYVLERIADHPISRIDELLPWAVAQHLGRGGVEPVPLPLAA